MNVWHVCGVLWDRKTKLINPVVVYKSHAAQQKIKKLVTLLDWCVWQTSKAVNTKPVWGFCLLLLCSVDSNNLIRQKFSLATAKRKKQESSPIWASSQCSLQRSSSFGRWKLLQQYFFFLRGWQSLKIFTLNWCSLFLKRQRNKIKPCSISSFLFLSGICVPHHQETGAEFSRAKYLCKSCFFSSSLWVVIWETDLELKLLFFYICYLISVCI